MNVLTDMTAALHNYITVDPEKFLADPKHLEMIYNMCKTVSIAFCVFLPFYYSNN